MQPWKNEKETMDLATWGFPADLPFTSLYQFREDAELASHLLR